jgi:hypothetical protein
MWRKFQCLERTKIIFFRYDKKIFLFERISRRRKEGREKIGNAEAETRKFITVEDQSAFQFGNIQSKN